MDPDTTRAAIDAFLAQPPFAVVGASQARAKYGAKVLNAYRQRGLTAYPVNPHRTRVQGLVAYPSLAALPVPVRAASIVTPPAVTERVVEQAAAAGLTHLWMQPGAESAAAVTRAAALGLTVIAGGPCVLVALGYREGAWRADASPG